MKNTRKVLSLILAISMAATLAACGGSTAPAASSAAPAAEGGSNLEKSLAVDTASLKGSDGQPLLLEIGSKTVTERPEDPDSLPETDPLRYWDIENAGWNTEKVDLPKSPADGAIGKKLVMIGQSEHPYWTAVFNGAKQMAAAYEMELTLLNPNGDLNQQNQMIDKAISEKPDMIFLATLDAQAGVQQFKKIYEAGIPAIAFNMVPTDEAMKYALCLTGPDDFGQFRKMSEFLAEDVGGKAGVAYLTHLPGGSPYFARTYGPISTFAEKYPDMKTLDIQSPGFDAPKCKQVVSDWITKFGDELTCIVISDDSAQAEGAAQALEAAGRTDVKCIAAGNSKVGMDLLKAGKLFAITYQSAEADGALPIKIAADYFNGLEVPPVAYLPQAVITQETVDTYMPAQW